MSEKTIPEWLPDWQDASSYAFPDENDREGWAWEFLRRNPDYQLAWKEQYVEGPLRRAWAEHFEEPGNVSPASAAAMIINNERARRFKPSADPAETSCGSYEEWKRENPWDLRTDLSDEEVLRRGRSLCRVFHLASLQLVDPCIGMVGSDALTRSVIAFENAFTPPMIRPTDFNAGWVDHMKEPGGQYLVCRFDARFPIKMQLEQVRARLVAIEKELVSLGDTARNQDKPRLNQFTEYLRFLDGEICGATVMEMAATIYPNLGREDGDRSGYNRVARGIKVAREIRDIGYSSLPLLGHEFDRNIQTNY